jgi:hypothetical protein
MTDLIFWFCAGCVVWGSMFAFAVALCAAAGHQDDEALFR